MDKGEHKMLRISVERNNYYRLFYNDNLIARGSREDVMKYWDKFKETLPKAVTIIQGVQQP